MVTWCTYRTVGYGTGTGTVPYGTVIPWLLVIHNHRVKLSLFNIKVTVMENATGLTESPDFIGDA